MKFQTSIRLVIPAFILLILNLVSCNGGSESNDDMVQDGIKFSELVGDKTLSPEERSTKIFTRIGELNKKYPSKPPVSSDSIQRTFVGKQPTKVGEFYYRKETATGPFSGNSYKGFTAVREYENEPESDAMSNQETSYSGPKNNWVRVTVSIADKTIEPQWKRATDWYYFSSNLRRPGEDSLKSHYKVSKTIVDSKGRIWRENINNIISEPAYSISECKTLINNRYEVVLSSIINNIDRPEYKKYKTELVAGPDFFYKVADIEWINKLPK